MSIDHLLSMISKACVFLGSAAMALLVVIFGWLVFGRYVLNATPTWVEQLALLLVCYIAFLGAAAGVREETHLGVTFLRDLFPTAIQRYIRIVPDLMLAVFGLVMAVACIELFEFGWQTKLPMLNIPESFRTLPAAICGGLIFLFSGTRALQRILQLVGDKQYPLQKVLD